VKKTTLTLILAAALSHAASAEPIYLTDATFEWSGDPALADAAEVGANYDGLGTSSLLYGIGINGSDPNSLVFEGVSGDGGLRSGDFLAGSLTLFNGDITRDSSDPFSTQLLLSLAGTDCVDDPVVGQQCALSGFGTVLLTFILTGNNDDPIASADGVCLEVSNGDTQCAWQIEQTTQSYDVIGAFGSFTVADLIPTTAGAFVTIGTDPTQNIIRRVPEPATVGMLLIGFAGLFMVRRERRARCYNPGQAH